VNTLAPLLWLVLSVLAVIGAKGAKAKLLSVGIIVACMAAGILIGAGIGLWGHNMEIGAHVAAPLMFWVGAVGAFHCIRRNRAKENATTEG